MSGLDKCSGASVVSGSPAGFAQERLEAPFSPINQRQISTPHGSVQRSVDYSLTLEAPLPLTSVQESMEHSPTLERFLHGSSQVGLENTSPLAPEAHKQSQKRVLCPTMVDSSQCRQQDAKRSCNVNTTLVMKRSWASVVSGSPVCTAGYEEDSSLDVVLEAPLPPKESINQKQLSTLTQLKLASSLPSPGVEYGTTPAPSLPCSTKRSVEYGTTPALSLLGSTKRSMEYGTTVAPSLPSSAQMNVEYVPTPAPSLPGSTKRSVEYRPTVAPSLPGSTKRKQCLRNKVELLPMA